MTSYIAVVGKGNRCKPDVEELAFAVGGALGERAATHGYEWVLLTGGMSGVMDAAARGFAGWRKTVLGLMPSDQADGTPSSAGLLLRTGLPCRLRNVVTATACDVMVVLPGSHGTVQEAVTALDLHRAVLAVGNHSGYLTDMLVARGHVPHAGSVGSLVNRITNSLP